MHYPNNEVDTIREYDRGFIAGYQAGLIASLGTSPTAPMTLPPVPMQNIPTMSASEAQEVVRKKRKVSAYSRRYGREYKRLRRKFTLKSGKLKKGYNHKRLVRMAHAAAKKVKR